MASEREISGSTRLYGIIGDPIAQARSPEVFNPHFEKTGIDAVFLPLHVRPADLPAAFRGFGALANMDGVVITIPHKFAAAALMDELGPHARRAGAINAARKTDGGGWMGELFDGIGFVEGLKAKDIDPAGKSFAIYGAGGAGTAIAFAIADEKPSRIALTDPAGEKAVALTASLRAEMPDLEVGMLDAAAGPGGFDIAVNASPLGLKPDDPLPFDPAKLSPGAIAVEAVMKPPVTRLLKEAERLGFRTHPGFHMLEGQFGPFLDFLGLPR
ncbi:MAG: shikimate dehydrogenase [Rhodospirillales bacterium]|nr:shikimate dehydrogenase [Rhodospirillales bacterium]